MKKMTKSNGAVATTVAGSRVWSECLQPATRRMADILVPIKGTTLPMSGIAAPTGRTGRADSTSILGTTTYATTPNFVDVPPFRPGRPPV